MGITNLLGDELSSMEALMDIQGYQFIFKLMNPVMRTEPAPPIYAILCGDYSTS